jgi:hypothetical protein
MTRVSVRSLAVAALCALIGCSDDASSSHGDSAARDATTEAGSSQRSDAGGHAPDAGRRTDAGRARDAGSRAQDSGARDADTSPITPDAGGAIAKLCPNAGWCELPDTALHSVCPDPDQYPEIQANEGCGGVINDWSGGIADAKRNRLLIWGGGHRGYFGNEVYALDLNALAMQRLNDPSDLAGVDVNECTSPEAYADGRASSRHTYDGLAYVANADAMFALGGAGIPCGYALTGTWTLDLAKVDGAPLGSAAPWTNMSPDPYPSKASYGVVSDYDPNSERVLVNDTYNLWSYDLASNTYTLLNDSDATAAHIDYHMTGRVDPKRRLFIVVGGGGNDDGGMQVFDLGAGSDHAQQDWTHEVSGCDALLAASSPGLAYDAVRDRMIGWAGGDDVYVFNPDAKTCETTTYAGGPERQNENGTFGRFRAFPTLGVFAVVNDPDTNAFVLRLPP